MKVIIVSGTPGTGKSTTAKKIAKEKNYEYIDVTKLIKENKLSSGYDKKRKTNIIDVKKLNKFLVNLISSGNSKASALSLSLKPTINILSLF